jgi:N-acetylmuramoyl-L-alanine amidase
LPLRPSTFTGSRGWRRRGAIAAVTTALVLLPVGASQAGFWDFLKGSSKPEHPKAAAKPAAAPKQDSAPKPEASTKPEPTTRSLPTAAKPAEKPQAAEKQVSEKERVAKTDKPKCDPAKFRLIVDVGHTRKSDGAMSARNVPEYDFNLRLATRLVEKLKSDGFTWTRLMITEGKARPSLIRRVATANSSGAELFLSIHHDSVPDKFEEPWEFEGKKAKFSDRFSGWSLFVSRDNANFDASYAFAKMIGKRMRGQGFKFAEQYSQPIMGKYRHDLLDKSAGVYRYDHLVVLMTTRMPAVLLEAGSIINRDEELQVAGQERQDATIGAVSDALKEYCGAPPAPPQEPLVSSNH